MLGSASSPAEKNNCSAQCKGKMFNIQPQRETLHMVMPAESVHITQILQSSAMHCAQVRCASTKRGSQFTWYMVVQADSVPKKKSQLVELNESRAEF